MLNRFLLVVFFLGFAHFSRAQSGSSECANLLNSARDAFNEGHLEDVSGYLSDCLKDGFSREQKIEAYKLLTITYLYLDDLFGAENSYLALLTLDPEYRVLPTDPVEFKYLSNRYITTPIISWTARAGVNLSMITPLQINTVGNENFTNRTYKTRPGFNFIGEVDVHFNKIVALAFELDFSLRSLYREETIFGEALTGLQADEHLLTEERQDLYLSLPVSLKFTYPGKTYYPYVYGGYALSYNLGVSALQKRTPAREVKIEGPALDLREATTTFSHSLVFGIGVKRRIKYKYILVDFRYRLGLTNMLAAQNQYNFDNDNIRNAYFKYSMPLDDMRWNDFQLTVGFVWPQYKPRARDEVTLQTVFKNMFGRKKNKE